MRYSVEVMLKYSEVISNYISSSLVNFQKREIVLNYLLAIGGKLQFNAGPLYKPKIQMARYICILLGPFSEEIFCIVYYFVYTEQNYTRTI